MMKRYVGLILIKCDFSKWYDNVIVIMWGFSKIIWCYELLCVCDDGYICDQKDDQFDLQRIGDCRRQDQGCKVTTKSELEVAATVIWNDQYTIGNKKCRADLFQSFFNWKR